MNGRRIRRREALGWLGGAAAAAMGWPAARSIGAGPQARFDAGRGVNLSHWFAQTPVGGYPDSHLNTYTTRRDVDLIAATGLEHVRFTIEPAILFNRRRPGELDAAYLRHLDRAMGMIADAGLRVIVDMHPQDEFKEPLNHDDRYVEAFGRFWESLAGHFRSESVERVAFEVINEPRVEDPGRWQAVADRLTAMLRAGAPEHTVVICGGRWSGVEDLLKLEPVGHANILYTFHMYDPFAFTHQGAGWTSPEFASMRRVPYPSTPENVAEAIAATEHARGKEYVADYGRQRWGAERVRRRAGEAAAWGNRHGVPLYCGEFGVYKRFAKPEHRAALLRDAREAFESYGVSWAMWDYRGGFSLADTSGPQRAVDPLIAEALGIRAS